MKSSVSSFHWIPRTLCILAILFISVFAADAFEEGRTIAQQLGAFFMHLIPSFILLAFLLIAWKRELLGGIIFTIAGILMTPVIFYHNYNVNHFSVPACIGVVMIITFPFIVVGVLFILSHYISKKDVIKTGEMKQ